MTRHVSPLDAAAKAEPQATTAAIVTASYAPDFERCRLLCETMDAHVTGHSMHYLLVEGRDVALFKQLEGPRRVVIDERDLLPSWLRVYSDPTSYFRRRIWLSLRTKPLRGWHVQQLRRIALARMVQDENLVFCDSDVAFVRPFDATSVSIAGKTNLFRRDDGLATADTPDHEPWHVNAAAVLGIAAPKVSAHDYISTLIPWRRQTVLAMCEHIERVNGRHWVAAIASRRKFSECTIYGRYVDEVIGGADHLHTATELCHFQWHGDAMSERELRGFVSRIGDGQVAIGLQSFIGSDIAQLRRVIVAGS